MRKQFCDAFVRHAQNQSTVFMTGDLGFMALEPVREAMGGRFINAGVAEQNMLSVGAAFARQGFDAWVYSIAPFCYARPFEQIRNDVCFHGLSVKIVGNGGGYGYGVMGPTHHAIEDYGILLTLPNLRVFVPVFDEDLFAVVPRMASLSCASYLRLGRGEPPRDWLVPAYAPWRQLTEGGGAIVIAVGPLAGTYISACEALAYDLRPNIWAVSELPLSHNPIPELLWKQIIDRKRLAVAEEHVKQGGFASELALHLLDRGAGDIKMQHLCAQAHHYAAYGSQNFLRKLSHLDADSLLVALDKLTVNA